MGSGPPGYDKDSVFLRKPSPLAFSRKLTEGLQQEAVYKRMQSSGVQINSDNDKDHSFSQFSVHKALTCPEGQSAWPLAIPCLAMKKLAPCKSNYSGVPAQIPCHLECSGLASVLKGRPWFTQDECVVKHCLPCLLWLLWCVGGSAVDEVGEEEWCIVVDLRRRRQGRLRLGRVRCLFVCCWLGCRTRGDGGSWVVLFASDCCFSKLLSMEPHFEPSCAVVSQVVSFVRSLFSLLCCRCVLMSSSHLLADLPCFRYPFCLWVPDGDKLGQAVFVVFGNNPCLLPVN